MYLFGQFVIYCYDFPSWPVVPLVVVHYSVIPAGPSCVVYASWSSRMYSCGSWLSVRESTSPASKLLWCDTTSHGGSL